MQKKKIHKFEHNRPVRGYSSYRERKARAEYLRESIKFYFKVALFTFLAYNTVLLVYPYI